MRGLSWLVGLALGLLLGACSLLPGTPETATLLTADDGRWTVVGEASVDRLTVGLEDAPSRASFNDPSELAAAVAFVIDEGKRWQLVFGPAGDDVARVEVTTSQAAEPVEARMHELAGWTIYVARVPVPQAETVVRSFDAAGESLQLTTT